LRKKKQSRKSKKREYEKTRKKKWTEKTTLISAAIWEEEEDVPYNHHSKRQYNFHSSTLPPSLYSSSLNPDYRPTFRLSPYPRPWPWLNVKSYSVGITNPSLRPPPTDLAIGIGAGVEGHPYPPFVQASGAIKYGSISYGGGATWCWWGIWTMNRGSAPIWNPSFGPCPLTQEEGVEWSDKTSSTLDLDLENDSFDLFPFSWFWLWYSGFGGKEEVDDPEIDRRFEEVDESDIFLFLIPTALDTAEREE
jgi:hypothetical protein